MKGSLATFLLGLLLGSPFVASAAPAAQPLLINVHGDGARATQLPEYDPAAPIAVTVRETGGQAIDGVVVVASGPAGESVRATLVRTADGSFGGTLVLQDAGAWHLRLTSRMGRMSTDTTPVTLVVQPPPPSNAWLIGVSVGVVIFVAIGGTGFVFLRRTVAERSPSGQARVA